MLHVVKREYQTLRKARKARNARNAKKKATKNSWSQAFRLYDPNFHVTYSLHIQQYEHP